MTEAALSTLARQAKSSGIACVCTSRITTGRVGGTVDVNDGKCGFMAAMRLIRKRAECCCVWRC
jgi:hypothetical protein